VTLLELRAMLARVNPRLLREDAGFSAATVAAAFGVSTQLVWDWEAGRTEPYSQAGFRWARFTGALEALALDRVLMAEDEAA